MYNLQTKSNYAVVDVKQWKGEFQLETNDLISVTFLCFCVIQLIRYDALRKYFSLSSQMRVCRPP